MRIAALAALSAFLISAGSASAETISTHVLDLARGVGGRVDVGIRHHDHVVLRAAERLHALARG